MNDRRFRFPVSRFRFPVSRFRLSVSGFRFSASDGVSASRSTPHCGAPPVLEGGFTFVELLLAVAIFGIVSAIVATVFYTGVSSWRTGTAAADALHHIDAVMEQVTAGLRSAYYPESASPLDKYGFVQENDGDEMPDCADKISWVKIGPSLVGEDATYAGVPHRTELFLMDEGSGPQGAGLYVRAWRLDGQEDDFDPEKDVEPVLLSSAVSGFDCKMVDREKEPEVGEEEPFEWLDEWETTNRVPESVLISIAVAPAPESKLAPMVFTRRVEIPLADLSWNPFNTSSDSRDSQRNSRSRPAGEGTGSGPTGGGIPGGSSNWRNGPQSNRGTTRQQQNVPNNGPRQSPGGFRGGPEPVMP